MNTEVVILCFHSHPRLPLNINDSDDRFGKNPLKIFVQFGFQMGLQVAKRPFW